jgi:hypothetical protein
VEAELVERLRTIEQSMLQKIEVQREEVGALLAAAQRERAELDAERERAPEEKWVRVITARAVKASHLGRSH